MSAHPQKRSVQGIAGILAAAAMVLALPASGVRLGELRTRSALGEPLDATIALRPARGENLVPGCFRLGSARNTDLLVETGASVAVETEGAATRLRLRTRLPLGEPAIQFRLNAGCPGGRSTTRDYEILLGPRIAVPKPATGTTAAGEGAAAAPASRTSAAAVPGTPLRAMPGDTLASLARAIYPRNAAAREAYERALRAENPALAGLGAQEAIPEGTAITLPDLRNFAASLAPAPAAQRPPAPATETKAPAAPKPGREPRKPPVAAAPPPRPAAEPAARAPAPATLPARTRGGGFELRLSAPEVDLSRSRGIDDSQRSRLRERLLILDADDQMSMLLSMRNNLRQLEGRVAELQLKLSTLPATPPVKPAPAPAAPAAPPPTAAALQKPAEPPKPAAPARPAEPPKAEPPKFESPKPEPAQAEPAKVAPPKAPVPLPETPAAKPAPAVEAPKPAVEPPKPAATPAAKAPAPAQAVPAADEGLPGWGWAALALVLAALGAAGAFAWHRKSRAKPPPPPPAAAPPTVSAELEEAAAMMELHAASEKAGGHRVVASSDADLATSVPGGDPAALRRRYIEERFPEIATGTLSPEDPDSVVKAARLFYEDGALPRAVELLQYAVEEKPAAIKPWLALFEIFRLEGLTGEFAELAARFRDLHGSTDYWRKVQFIGREIDPQNPVYRDGGSLETIAFPSGRPPAPITFDPLAENWLNAPMDFTTDALATSLRAGLLADAGVTETELVADPMPALKNVEMFNVA
jgi:pilus assembly protein FimV